MITISSQLLGYSKVVNPKHSFIISPTGISSPVNTLIKIFKRYDILEYSKGSKIRIAQVYYAIGTYLEIEKEGEGEEINLLGGVKVSVQEEPSQQEENSQVNDEEFQKNCEFLYGERNFLQNFFIKYCELTKLIVGVSQKIKQG